MDGLRSLKRSNEPTGDTKIHSELSEQDRRSLRESTVTPGPSRDKETQEKPSQIRTPKKINSDAKILDPTPLATKFNKLSKNQQEAILRIFPDLQEIPRQKSPQKVEICQEDALLDEDSEGDELSDEEWSEDDDEDLE